MGNVYMPDCIFCAVRDGPKSTIIMEDQNAFVILDKYPSSEGHMLVISKLHSASMIEADKNNISSMFIIAREMAVRLKERLGADGVNVSTNIGREAGQIIDHFHIHVIPRYAKPKEGFEIHKELSTERMKVLMAKLS